MSVSFEVVNISSLMIMHDQKLTSVAMTTEIVLLNSCLYVVLVCVSDWSLSQLLDRDFKSEMQ